MILIFIGKNDFGTKLIKELNNRNFTNLILVQNDIRHTSLSEMKYSDVIKSGNANEWIIANSEEIEFIFDLRENAALSKLIWSLGCKHQIPLIILNSMSDFQIWAKTQIDSPLYWAIFDSIIHENAIDEMITEMLERKDSGVKKKK